MKKEYSYNIDQTFRMVTNLSKNFVQTQSFFIVWNEIQMLFLIGETGSRERKSLNFKKSTKTFTQDTKDISNYIYLLCHSVICFHSTRLYWFSPKGTLGLQRISKAQLIIQMAHLHCHLPLNCYNPLGILQRVIKIK